MSTRSAVVVRSPADRWSVRIVSRSALVGLVLVLVLVLLVVLALTTGDYPLSPRQVAAVLVGRGAPEETFIVETLRLPRVLAALLVGAAFAVSGAVFQSLTRNPLGSPDIVGLSTGAATGALIQMLVLHGTGVGVAVAAAAGGLATAALVYVLSWQHGIQGYRLILVGIGIAALLQAANAYLLTRADFLDAQAAAVWLVGSLTSARWADVRIVAIALAALLPASFVLARPLRQLELGDDAAAALGTPLERTRLGLVATGALLAAAATATAGPVAFVALIAPQVARRIARASGPTLPLSALTGAALLLLADVGSQRLFTRELPVGVVTGVVGGLYLAGLLASSRRSGLA